MKRKIEICENCKYFYSFVTFRKTACKMAGGEWFDPFLRDNDSPFESRDVPYGCVFSMEQMMANFNSGDENGHS